MAISYFCQSSWEICPLLGNTILLCAKKKSFILTIRSIVLLHINTTICSAIIYINLWKNKKFKGEGNDKLMLLNIRVVLSSFYHKDTIIYDDGLDSCIGPSFLQDIFLYLYLDIILLSKKSLIQACVIFSSIVFYLLKRGLGSKKRSYGIDMDEWR